MGFDLGSSQSTTRTDASVQSATDNATVIKQTGAGLKLVGSTYVKVGKGGSFNIEDPAGSAALQHLSESLGSLLSSQASLGMNGERNPTTGLTKPDAPADYTKPALTGVAILGAGLLLLFFIKRR